MKRLILVGLLLTSGCAGPFRQACESEMRAAAGIPPIPWSQRVGNYNPEPPPEVDRDRWVNTREACANRLLANQHTEIAGIVLGSMAAAATQPVYRTNIYVNTYGRRR